MEEKFSVVMEWLANQTTMTELCRSFGISRTLGYAYIRRYMRDGHAGLEEMPRAPRRVWNKTSSCVRETHYTVAQEQAALRTADHSRAVSRCDRLKSTACSFDNPAHP
jgi:transposase-like protein